MATPVNPLDKYATYACHFELHAALSNDELHALDNRVDERSTTRFDSNGTLLINTRKDAHQVINNVKFESVTPNTTRTDVMEGIAGISFDVHEPGSFAFVEKIKARMLELNVINVMSMVFGLKIVFVGRTPDNVIEIKAQKVMTMLMKDMTGTFTEKGGVYQLLFVPNVVAASTRSGQLGPHINFAYVNKSISFQASTVNEALIKLEDKINDVYTNEYSKTSDSGSLRKIKFILEFDKSDCYGDVIGMQSKSFSPSEERSFVFSPDKPISSYIMDIIKRTPAINERIGASKDKLGTRFQEGVFYPIITPSVTYLSDSVEIKYILKFYKGGGHVGGGPFEFDFYFANAGKNVDVLSYDVKFSQLQAFLSWVNPRGVDVQTNLFGQLTDPVKLKNSICENVTQPKLFEEVNRNIVEGKSGDLSLLPARSAREEQGYNSFPWDKVPSAKLAGDSISSFIAAQSGAFGLQGTVEIRGHLSLLQLCLATRDSEVGNNINDFVWLKINVFMQDGGLGDTAKKRPFYYTGYYKILAINNTFIDGQFLQHITIAANEKS